MFQAIGNILHQAIPALNIINITSKYSCGSPLHLTELNMLTKMSIQCSSCDMLHSKYIGML